MNSPPLPLGTVIPTLGRIEMIGLTGGERYYWLIDKRKVVSMMPWSVVEPLARGDSAGESRE